MMCWDIGRRGHQRAWLVRVAELETDDCVLWPFGVNPRGYGRFGEGGTTKIASRELCILAHGEPPAPSGWDAAHSCRKPACCNKRHVAWKTHADNLEDRRRDGTLPMGETFSRHRLTEAQAREVLRDMGDSAVYATRFGVHYTTIDSLKGGRSWKHLR